MYKRQSLSRPVLRVSDYRGKVLFNYECDECKGQQVVSAETAFIISDILADNQARASAFGVNSVLKIENHRVAVKTGTTNDLRDNWTFGYTPDYLVGVWVGNNNNKSMSRVASGITGASPIWHEVMSWLLNRGDNNQPFVQPDGIVKVKVCLTTQTLGCEACPLLAEEYFKVGSEPTKACHENQFTARKENEEKNMGDKRDRLLDGAMVDRWHRKPNLPR